MGKSMGVGMGYVSAWIESQSGFFCSKIKTRG